MTEPDRQALSRQVEQRLADDRFRAAVRRMLIESGLPDAMAERMVFRIPAQDQMLAHSLDHHRDASIALSQYFNVSVQQFNAFRQVAECAFDRPADELRILDFACGYGRLLRFASAWLPPDNLRGAEIQHDALAIVRELFGVDGDPTTGDPGALRIDRRFDLIWVASLFSHLPDRLFRGWLNRLHALLAPGGVLCFSVRDASLHPDPASIPADGFLYRPESERIPIESSVYGTAWADERYVRAAIEEAVAAPVRSLRIPRALAMEQDLYLLFGTERDAPFQPEAFRRGPWGWVDRMRREADGRVRIEGWAGTTDAGGLDRIEIRIEERAERIVPTRDRPDVVAAFGDPALRRSGFQYETRLDDPDGPCFVEVSAAGRHRERALLYAGPLRISDNGDHA